MKPSEGVQQDTFCRVTNPWSGNGQRAALQGLRPTSIAWSIPARAGAPSAEIKHAQRVGCRIWRLAEAQRLPALPADRANSHSACQIECRLSDRASHAVPATRFLRTKDPRNCSGYRSDSAQTTAQKSQQLIPAQPLHMPRWGLELPHRSHLRSPLKQLLPTPLYEVATPFSANSNDGWNSALAKLPLGLALRVWLFQGRQQARARRTLALENWFASSARAASRASIARASHPLPILPSAVATASSACTHWRIDSSAQAQATPKHPANKVPDTHPVCVHRPWMMAPPLVIRLIAVSLLIRKTNDDDSVARMLFLGQGNPAQEKFFAMCTEQKRESLAPSSPILRKKHDLTRFGRSGLAFDGRPAALHSEKFCSLPPPIGGPR